MRVRTVRRRSVDHDERESWSARVAKSLARDQEGCGVPTAAVAEKRKKRDLKLAESTAKFNALSTREMLS